MSTEQKTNSPRLFERSTLLRKMYGDDPSKKQLRRFNKYWDSAKRKDDQEAFERSERRRFKEASDREKLLALQRAKEARRAALLRLKKEEQELAVRKRELELKAGIDVKPETEDKAKGGAKSETKKENPAATPVTTETPTEMLIETPTETPIIISPSVYDITLDKGEDNRNKWESWDDEVTINGISYPIYKHTQQDRLYAYDSTNKKFIPLFENWFGTPDGIRDGATWTDPDKIASIADIKRLGDGWGLANIVGLGDDRYFYTSEDGTGRIYLLVKHKSKPNLLYRYDPVTHKLLAPFSKEWIDVFKQGGNINKYQQGGNMNQQELQQQIVQLVQAAMQGDQKAGQQIEQIMLAAKNGDQQAAQIAQMIQQVAQQMKGGSVKAALGAKLNYIQKLKKNCPEGTQKVYLKNGGCMCQQKAQNGGFVASPSLKKKNEPDKISKKPPMQKLLKPADPIKSAACGGKTKKNK